VTRRQGREGRQHTSGPNPEAVGTVAAEHLGPILYALEVCAVHMEGAGRTEEAEYYRKLATMLGEAGGRETGET
jgi:hypothetical protein